MSHQGYEGWFPECLVCGMGNLGGNHLPIARRLGRTRLQGYPRLCQRRVAASTGGRRPLVERVPVVRSTGPGRPQRLGIHGLLHRLWNHFAARGLHPPATAIAARRLSEVEWDGPPRP